MITTRILSGFQDPSFTPKEWNELLSKGKTNVIALTWEWQKTWWEHYGRGKLLLILVEEDGAPVALAPLFADGGMIYNLFVKETLDFIGDIKNSEVLEAILFTAKQCVSPFYGFRFYFIPESSPTAVLVDLCAKKWGFRFLNESTIPSPYVEIAGKPEEASKISRKKSLRSHENYFLREGKLEVQHFRAYEKVEPYFQDFVEQHINRRSILPDPSPLAEAHHLAFYKALMTINCETGWLRFTRIAWNDQSIAYGFGFEFKGRYLFLITSFNLEFVKHSPGEVLLKNLLSESIREGLRVFDFGIGDEAYKYRFSTAVANLQTIGLYPN